MAHLENSKKAYADARSAGAGPRSRPTADGRPSIEFPYGYAKQSRARRDGGAAVVWCQARLSEPECAPHVLWGVSL